MSNEEKLRKIFADALYIPESEVTDELSYGSLDWDSITHMALISLIEERFNIAISQDEMATISTFANTKEFLTRRSIQF